MIKTLFIILPLLSGSLSASVSGWELTPIFTRQFGSTLFRFEFPAGSESDFEGNTFNFIGKSELEYPVNSFIAGAELIKSAGMFSLHLSGWTNINQPSGKMLDSDWAGIESQDVIGTTKILQKFSYTESNAEVLTIGGTAGITFSPRKIFGKMTRLGIVYRADYYDFDITGVSGWQLGIDSTYGVYPEKFHFENLYQDTSVLTYEVTYHSLSLTGKWEKNRNASPSQWILDAEFSPLTIAYDEDYHLLRFKKSNALTFGIVIGMGGTFSYSISPRVRFHTTAGFRYIRTIGAMDQIFYKDDPWTVENEKGMEFKDIDTRFRSLTATTSFGLSYRF